MIFPLFFFLVNKQFEVARVLFFHREQIISTILATCEFPPGFYNKNNKHKNKKQKNKIEFGFLVARGTIELCVVAAFVFLAQFMLIESSFLAHFNTRTLDDRPTRHDVAVSKTVARPQHLL